MPIIPPADLAVLRSEPCRSKLFLVVQQPCRYDTVTDEFDVDDMVWYGKIEVAPIGDPVVSLEVKSDFLMVGDRNVKDGMTVLFSTAAGGYGKGERAIAKIHGDQTLVAGMVQDTMYVHVSSDLSRIERFDYVTVLDEHRFWTRYPRVEGPAAALVWYKDYGYFATSIGEALANLGYTWTQLGGNDAARRQASMPAAPIMGPHAVRFIDPTVGSVNVNFDWSDSYATEPGVAVDAWTSWGETNHAGGTWNSVVQVPGATNYTTISGQRGFRTVLEIGTDGTDPIAEFRRGTRYVFTLRRPGEKQAGDPDDCYPITDFELQECSGSFDSGGWRGRVRVFGPQAHEYYVQPGALCILFADDWYGSTHESVAPDDDLYTDRENIVMIGYVGDGSITQDSETGDVSFDMLSLSDLMKTRENYPVPIENNDLATTWYQTPDLTIDRASHHYLTWHTNLKQVTDVFQTGDTREIAAMDFLAGDAYSTVDTFLNDRIFARLLCNRFGQVKMDIDRDMEAAGSGATLFTFQDGDQIADFTADEINESPVSIIDLGGIYWNAGAFTPMLSHAPGVVSRYWGNPESSMSLAIASQAQLNILAGRLLAYKNNRFPRITVPMSGNWRVFDIWPQEYIDLSKVTWRYNFEGLDIVRDVSLEHDAAAGALFTTLTLAAETNGPAGMTIIIPDELPKPDPGEPPDWPGPGGGEDSGRRIVATDVGVFVTDNIGAVVPAWYPANDGFVTANDLYVYHIARDPYHWWTSETERTLWAVTRTGIWKMTNFPYGTWVCQITYAALMAKMGYSDATCACPWVAKGRINLSIELDGRYAVICNLPDKTNGGWPVWWERTAVFVCQAAAIVNGTELCADGSGVGVCCGSDFTPGWGDVIYAPHHGTQHIYATTARTWNNVGFSQMRCWKTVNGGGTWVTVDGPISWWNGDGEYTSLALPYIDAANPDQYIFWMAGANPGVNNVARQSSNQGATFSDITALIGIEAYDQIREGFTQNRIYGQACRLDGTNSRWTGNGGITWVDLPQYALGFFSTYAFDLWDGDTLRSVLVGGYPAGGPPATGIYLLYWRNGVAAWADKTGNLHSVHGVNYIWRVDRDSTGTA